MPAVRARRRTVHNAAPPPFCQPSSDTRLATTHFWFCSQRRVATASATRSRAVRTERSRTVHCEESPREPKLSGNSTTKPAAASRSPQSR